MRTSESDKGTLNLWTLWSCVGMALILGAVSARATGTVNYWTNAAGDLLWSNPLNWNNNVAAGSADWAQFNSVDGTTNGPGLVNNIVDVDTTVQGLLYQPMVPAYHTTLINPGVTLTVFEPAPQANGDIFALRVGTVMDPMVLSHVAIRGAGRLVVGDTNSPAITASAAIMRVNVACSNAGPYWATLDMSELDYFEGAPSEIRIGGTGSGAGTQGTWIMAKTNLVIVGSPSQSSGYGGFTIGFTSANTDWPSAGDVQLGQENVLQLSILKVGCARATNWSLSGPGGGVGEWSKAGWGGTMEFRKGLVNPTLTMRGVDGVIPAGNIIIGDAYNQPNANSTNTATGIMDLSEGTVDILVGGLIIGRNVNSTTTGRTGSGKGELTWTAGTIEVTNLVRLGVQVRTNAGNATGVLNVRSNAVLKVTGPTFNLGNHAGNAAGTASGTLNIVYGGVVTAAGDIAEVNTGGNGTSTINLTNSALSVGGLVRVDNLTANNAVLSLTAGPTINAANPVCDVPNLTLVTSLTLNVTGSVSLAQYPLIRYQGSIGGAGYGVVVLGALPPQVSGYLSNNTANSSIDLVVTNVPAVKWAGTVNGDWDINFTANWISTITSAATTYKEPAIPGDPVIFDDTATGTKTVNLTTVLSPAMVSVNSTGTYVFGGTGGISGPGGLSKTGSGTLALANSGANDYTGITAVGGGTLLVNGSLTGSGAVIVQAGATLSGTGAISGPVTIASGGTLATGNNGIGTLTFNGSLALAAGSFSVFDVDTDTLVSDLVAGYGGVTYGGTLQLNFSGGGTALTAGAAIQLFSSAGSGTFAHITPPFPKPGLYWNTSTLNSDGVLRIQAEPPSDTLTWTNVAGGNLFWSNPVNWTNLNGANTTPQPVYSVVFGNDVGTTNVQGAVNNIVDANVTVTNLYYCPVAPSYHTTLVNPGVTLSVQDPMISGQIFGLRGNVLPNTTLLHTAIRGGGRLVVGDANNPSTTSTMRINAASYTPGPYWATLDMSDLNTFECGVGEIRIGATGSSAGTQGTWIMAKTNLVVVGSTSGSSGYVGFTIGLTSSADDYPSAGDVQLGQENVLRLHTLIVGRTRATNVSLGGPGGGVGEWSKAGWGGTMEFRSGLVNPTLTVRWIDGVSPLASLLIGDNNYVGSNNSTNTATGVMDLTGGTVDILASGLYIGRNNANTTASRTGSGLGVLTWTAGTIEATNLVRVGVQAANNAGNATGVVNVQSNAVLNVTGPTFNLGNDAGSAAGTGNGTLNIVNGGVVTAAGDIAEINGTDGDGTSTINLTSGILSAGGLVRVDNLTADNSVLSLTVGPTIDAANPVCDVSNLTLVTSLTLNVTGSVSLAQYPLIRYQGSIGGGGYGVASLGSLLPNVFGYLSNNIANSSIDLVVTNVPALPPPTIAPVTVSGTDLVVTVPTVTGANYVLQSTTNLTPTINWVNESTNAGTGGDLILNVPIEPGKPQKFVRFWVY